MADRARERVVAEVASGIEAMVDDLARPVLVGRYSTVSRGA